MRRMILFWFGLAMCVSLSCNAYAARSVPKSVDEIMRSHPGYLLRSHCNYTVDTKKATYNDKEIKFKISPDRDERGRVLGFILEISNKTAGEISIDWAYVYYIVDGKMSGGFMFEGVNYGRRNEIKHSPLIILPKSTHDMEIFPNNLAIFIRDIDYTEKVHQQFEFDGWNHKQMEPGTHGVYAKVKIGNKEKTIKVTTDIKQ